MGRSVSVPHNAEIVCYRYLEPEPFVEDLEEGDDIEAHEPTELDYQWAFESMLEDLQEYAPTLWPSLVKCDKWLDREDHAVLENDHCYIGISEYCSMVAIWVVPKADEYEASWYADEARKASLSRRWVSQIEKRFRETWGDLRKVATFSNGEAVYEKVA